jgi:hypothetical protein
VNYRVFHFRDGKFENAGHFLMSVQHKVKRRDLNAQVMMTEVCTYDC